MLGCGLDRVYPPEHGPLAKVIAASGAIVSELPPAAEPKPEHFPRRNRIISGVALGVVVVEASLKSGSLITARCAADQGREVMAVPGTALGLRHKGSPRLIRDGAALVETADDVLAVAGPRAAPRRSIGHGRRGGGARPLRRKPAIRSWLRSKAGRRCRSAGWRRRPACRPRCCSPVLTGHGIAGRRPAAWRGLPDASDSSGKVRDAYGKTPGYRRVAGKSQDIVPLPRRKFGSRRASGTSATSPQRASEVPKEIKDKPWGRMAVDVDGDFTPYYVVPLSKKKRISELPRPPSRTPPKCCWRPTRTAKASQSARTSREVLQAEGADPPHRLPRDHRGSGPRGHGARPGRQSEPGEEPGGPHPRPAVRLHAVAGAVEEGRHRPQRRPRPERGGPPSSSSARRSGARSTRHRFWDLEARIAAEGREFTATLVRLGNQRIASGKDFDAATGKLKESTARLLDRGGRHGASSPPTCAAACPGRSATSRSGRRRSGRRRRSRRRRCRQEANRKLGFSADRTMKAAQGLFQGLDLCKATKA